MERYLANLNLFFYNIFGINIVCIIYKGSDAKQMKWRENLPDATSASR